MVSESLALPIVSVWEYDRECTSGGMAKYPLMHLPSVQEAMKDHQHKEVVGRRPPAGLVTCCGYTHGKLVATPAAVEAAVGEEVCRCLLPVMGVMANDAQ